MSTRHHHWTGLRRCSWKSSKTNVGGAGGKYCTGGNRLGRRRRGVGRVGSAADAGQWRVRAMRAVRAVLSLESRKRASVLDSRPLLATKSWTFCCLNQESTPFDASIFNFRHSVEDESWRELVNVWWPEKYYPDNRASPQEQAHHYCFTQFYTSSGSS